MAMQIKMTGPRRPVHLDDAPSLRLFLTIMDWSRCNWYWYIHYDIQTSLGRGPTLARTVLVVSSSRLTSSRPWTSYQQQEVECYRRRGDPMVGFEATWLCSVRFFWYRGGSHHRGVPTIEKLMGEKVWKIEHKHSALNFYKVFQQVQSLL